MFKKLLLALGKGMFKDLSHELIQTVTDQVQEEISGMTKLTEKERAAANMVLDLVEQRAFDFVDSKFSA